MKKWLERLEYQGRPVGYDSPVNITCVVGVEVDDGFGGVERKLSPPLSLERATEMLAENGVPAEIAALVSGELATEIDRLRAELAATAAARDVYQEQIEALTAGPPSSPFEP